MTGKVGQMVDIGKLNPIRYPSCGCPPQPVPRTGLRGFTLIEILVVVSIISILAAVAVPNFLEAQVRSKVSRARNDMRVVAVALESYHVDNNKYPDRSKTPTGLSFLGLPDTKERAKEMSVLTTPISYVSTIPIDIFEIRVEPPNNLIDYYSPIIVQHMRKTRFPSAIDDFPTKPVSAGGTWKDELSLGSNYQFGWMLISVGPDSFLGNASRAQGNYPHQMSSDPHDRGFNWHREYDPTNGTTSLGNISRFQKHGATADDAFSTRPE